MTKGKKSAVKTVSWVMVLTLLGKILGLLRDRLLSVTYGSGMETNAFLAASRIPRVFFDAVFASAVAACFIPVFNEYLTNKGKKEAFRFSNDFFTLISLLCCILTVLGIVFADQLVTLFAGGYDAETRELCISLTRLMFPSVLFTGIAFSMVGVLQSMDEFNIPALISVVSNIAVILYFIFFNDRFGIYGLALAFLLGWLLQALVQVPSLVKKGYLYRPSFHFRSEGMKKVFVLMLPVMVSTWVQPINLAINTRFGSHLFQGAGVSAIEFANNLYLIITGVFVLSVTNVIFPRLSKLTAQNEATAFRDTISSVIHSSLFFVVPLMVGMMTLARPLVDLVYGGGEFDAFSVDITARALVFLSLGMVGYTVQTILSRAFFAEQSGKVPLIAGVCAIVSNILLCMVLTDPFDVAGLAVASSISCIINALVLIISLEKRGLGFLSKKFCFDLLKVFLAAAVMGCAVYGVRLLVDDLFVGVLGKLVTVFVPTLAGLLVYFVVTLVLRIDEGKAALSLVKKLLHRS